MAKLYFYYSAMNAGKTTALLQSSYNYHERGMRTLIYTTAFDIKFDYNGNGVHNNAGHVNKNYIQIQSRIGLKSYAKAFTDDTNFFSDIATEHNEQVVHCVLIDECQFLNRQQVIDLGCVVDQLDIPVLCYGLRTDFRAELFSGSLWLLAWADKLIELKTICYCGRKANRVLRFDSDGKTTFSGKQIMIGKENCYLSVCRRHFMKIYTT
ncbi:thymidine kinase [Blochmannia endosymbiont of Polyrhachis (Hedomyrma) turneri]|uniref:thymidine kinase n=1 Tax=Blochmannia endosymbiont of Polyrhachis (Hedomyrma) turneri TaxID=1505596 RepID=UPI00061A5834|nr:thymidine kinase [Blochmannia endosymbiont of Polyrhachis (Hedomyrma) turneri]AKC59994.1 thymidine kinase [Blochmannia endosymbiont of Polyrhachis (Hedomyrma) turneri]